MAGVAERPPAVPLAIVEALKVVGAQSPSGDAALAPVVAVVAVVGSLVQVPDDAPVHP